MIDSPTSKPHIAKVSRKGDKCGDPACWCQMTSNLVVDLREDALAMEQKGIGDLGARNRAIAYEIERLTRELADLNKLIAGSEWYKEAARLRAVLEWYAGPGGYDYGIRAKKALRPADEPKATLNVPSGWQGKDPWFNVGDLVQPVVQICGLKPVCTITEITERGFKYTHDRISMGPRFGWFEEGETYEPSGYRPAVKTAPEPDSRRCAYCAGTGQVSVGERTCHNCGGAGRLPSKTTSERSEPK